MTCMVDDRSTILRDAWHSLATIGLKSGAYLLTGSVGLLSGALDSGVNLAGVRVLLPPPYS